MAGRTSGRTGRRPEVHVHRTAREGLGDTAHEQQVRRAGEQEAPVPARPIHVHRALDREQQIGFALHLVQRHPRRGAAEVPRRPPGPLMGLRIVQGQVEAIRQEGLGLARACSCWSAALPSAERRELRPRRVPGASRRTWASNGSRPSSGRLSLTCWAIYRSIGSMREGRTMRRALVERTSSNRAMEFAKCLRSGTVERTYRDMRDAADRSPSAVPNRRPGHRPVMARPASGTRRRNSIRGGPPVVRRRGGIAGEAAERSPIPHRGATRPSCPRLAFSMGHGRTKAPIRAGDPEWTRTVG